MSASDSIFIHFNDVDASRLSFSEASIIQWLTDLARDHQRPIEEMNYIFCSDDFLYQLNKEHLGHSYLTDILTFPYSYDPIQAEIYISLDRIEDNALVMGCPKGDELLRVISHGLLHMLGFNDKTEAESLEMRAQEDLAIQKFNP